MLYMEELFSFSPAFFLKTNVNILKILFSKFLFFSLRICKGLHFAVLIINWINYLNRCLAFYNKDIVLIYLLKHFLKMRLLDQEVVLKKWSRGLWRPLERIYQFSSVQFRRSVVSDSLRLHELQQARPPCPSPTPRVHPNSCPSSWWCHPAISSSVVPFSSCPQSLPASESFPMSQLFAWGGQSTGVSASLNCFLFNTFVLSYV